MRSQKCNLCEGHLTFKVELSLKQKCQTCRKGADGDSFGDNTLCSCVVINEICYRCEKCHMRYFLCNDTLYAKTVTESHCSVCINNIKRRHLPPNTVYEFNEEYACWILIQKRCSICETMIIVTEHTHNHERCDACNHSDELYELRNLYPDMEFAVVSNDTGDYVAYKTLCICGLSTDWINVKACHPKHIHNAKYSDDERYEIVVAQCASCDPSDQYSRYGYKNNIWRLRQAGRECMQCYNIVWNDILTCVARNECSGFVPKRWGDEIVCHDCDLPILSHIKFKRDDRYVGCIIDKIKVLKNGRHYWINAHSDITIDYKCDCQN